MFGKKDKKSTKAVRVNATSEEDFEDEEGFEDEEEDEGYEDEPEDPSQLPPLPEKRPVRPPQKRRRPKVAPEPEQIDPKEAASQLPVSEYFDIIEGNMVRALSAFREVRATVKL